MVLSPSMKAIYYDQFGITPQIREVPVPIIGNSSVLVKVMATGLCRSDWHGWQGHDRDILLPHVPGHEFAGEIVQLGQSVKGWQIGDRVTTPFIQACGHCIYCQHGDHQVCENQEQAGFTHWGSFAEFVEVRNAEVNLVKLPEQMTYEVAAVLGCRFGTAFRAIMDQAQIEKEDFVLILGCGGVGLSAILIAKALGAKVAAVDLNPAALSFAQECGLDMGFEILNEQTRHQLIAWSGRGVKACIDAIGHPKLLNEGLNVLQRRGKYVQVGLMPDDQGLPQFSMERVLAHELEIIGSHGIQGWQYGNLLKFIVDYQLDIEKLITNCCNLEKAIEHFTLIGANNQVGVTVIAPD